MISFTINTCKNKNTIIQTLTNNFEKHFAMYSLTNIKALPSIEFNSKEVCYFVKCTKEESKEILKALSSFECSHFEDTLVPIFTELDNGLKIEFRIRGE